MSSVALQQKLCLEWLWPAGDVYAAATAVVKERDALYGPMNNLAVVWTAEFSCFVTQRCCGSCMDKSSIGINYLVGLVVLLLDLWGLGLQCLGEQLA